MPFDSFITFLPTQDLEKTTHFYEQVLKLPLELDQTSCRIYRIAQGGFIGFCVKAEIKIQEGVILTLVTENVDEWEQIFTEHHLPIETSPTFNPDYQIYQMFVRDPNGYLIEIQRFEDPRWGA